MKHILLAEDERELSRALVTILQEFDFKVTPVYDGKQALDSILEYNYDGIVMDIMMPKFSGLEVLQKIREQSISTPVLLLTAKSSTDDIVVGLENGANDYLTKPFSSKELIARIRAMTRQSSSMSPEQRCFGKVVLSYKDNSLRTDKTSVGLSKHEFSLMELFIKNPSKALQGDFLTEHIWGDESVQGQLELYISYLIKKLEAIGADITIKRGKNSYMLVKSYG